jgi:hypothetical protein
MTEGGQVVNSDVPTGAREPISITHWSEAGFVDGFRADLAASTAAVIILSPFVSQNRAFQYLAVLHAVNLRGVEVTAYVRPLYEQPDTLRTSYDSVMRSLERTGVHVHVRPGMHEKVAVIDGCILWHGSLNILSHNDTRESMLRITCAELVKEVLGDLGLRTTAPAPVGPATEQLAGEESLGDKRVRDETRSCPVCGSKMKYFESANLWICAASPQCSGTLSKESVPAVGSGSPVMPQAVELACPICGSPMAIHRGVFGRIACSSSACGFTLDPRLSAGIARVLKQRTVA